MNNTVNMNKSDEERARTSARRCSNCHSWDDWNGTGNGLCMKHGHNCHAKHLCSDFMLIRKDDLLRPASERSVRF